MKDSAAVYMIPRFKIIVVVLFLLALGASYCPAVTFVWNGSDSEDWYDPGNWTPFGVPGTNDIIDITNGTIDLTSPVVIGGQLNWSGGTIWDSDLTVATNGVVNIEDSVLISNYFNNYGTINWQGGAFCFGANEGQLENQLTGTVNIQCDQTMSGSWFGNAGTVVKSAGTNTTLIATGFFGAAFSGNGLVSVQSGTLWLSNFDDGESLCGDMEVATNGTLLLSGLVVLQAPLNFGGAGTILMSNGIIDGGPFSGHLSCAATELWGGQGELEVTSNSVLNVLGDLTIDGGASLMNYGTLNWQTGVIEDDGLIYNQPGSVLNINSAQALTSYGDGDFYVSGGLMMNGGTNTCLITESFGAYGGSSNQIFDIESGTLYASNFTDGGDAFGGEFQIATNAVLLLSGVVTLNPPLNFEGAGTVLASNAFVYGSFSGGLSCAATEINLDVMSNGVLNIVGNITNDGLNNCGTVNWQSGLFQNNAGIGNKPGSVFVFNSGQALALSGGGGFEASGEILVQGGTNTCSINEMYYGTDGNGIPSIVVQGGTLWLNDSLDVTGDVEVATNASLLLSGSVTLTSPMNLGGAGTILMLNGTLNGTFSGHLNCTETEVTTGLTVTSNGTLTIVGHTIFDPSSPLINYGTVNWQNGLIDDESGIYNQSGAVLKINSGVPLGAYGDGAFGGPGTIIISGGTNTAYLQSDFGTSGKLQIQSGHLEVDGSSSFQGAVVCLHITNPTNYGQIILDEPTALSGNLSVGLDRGYVPNPGATFALVQYAGNSGYFGSLNLPSKYAWSTNYSPSQFTLTALGLKPVLVPSLVASGTPGQPSELQLTFTGNANAIYSVLATTNLALPLSCWSNLGTASALSSNSYQFVDPQSTNLAARFYGVRLGDDPGSP